MMLPLLATLALALPPAENDPAGKAFEQAIVEMNTVVESLQDATFTMYKQEWINGGYVDWVTMEVKVRRPEDAFMRMTDGPGAGRVVLYRGPDWNDGHFRVDPGRFMPVLNLHPDGRLARRGNRHSVREIAPRVLIGKITRDALRVRDSPTHVPDVTDLGQTTVRGESSRCFEARLPKASDPAFYAHRVRLCIKPETGMPNSIRVWDHEDGEVRLVESYDYIDMRVNPGLTDSDFAPETYGL